MLTSALRLWRQNPLLCLPLFAAELLHYALERGWPYVQFWVANRWPRQHSVLTGNGSLSTVPIVGVYHGGLLAAVLLLRALLQVLESGLWCAAFVLTAASLHEEHGHIFLSWESAWAWLRSHLARVAVFSAGCWLALVTTGLAVGMLMVNPAIRRLLRSSPQNHTLPPDLLVLIPLCCVISVLALKLIPNGRRASIADCKSTALYTSLAVALSRVILTGASRALFRVATEAQATVLHLMTLIIADLPYVVLFLVLGLLTIRRDGGSGVIEAGGDRAEAF